MATAIAAIGTAILGAGASATAATITGGLVMGAASYGAMSLVGGQEGGGGTTQQQMAPLADKTLPQEASMLDDPLVDEERESKKRRVAAAKSRFKVDLDEPGAHAPKRERELVEPVLADVPVGEIPVPAGHSNPAVIEMLAVADIEHRPGRRFQSQHQQADFLAPKIQNHVPPVGAAGRRQQLKPLIVDSGNQRRVRQVRPGVAALGPRRQGREHLSRRSVGQEIRVHDLREGALIQRPAEITVGDHRHRTLIPHAQRRNRPPLKRSPVALARPAYLAGGGPVAIVKGLFQPWLVEARIILPREAHLPGHSGHRAADQRRVLAHLPRTVGRHDLSVSINGGDKSGPARAVVREILAAMVGHHRNDVVAFQQVPSQVVAREGLVPGPIAELPAADELPVDPYPKVAVG